MTNLRTLSPICMLWPAESWHQAFGGRVPVFWRTMLPSCSERVPKVWEEEKKWVVDGRSIWLPCALALAWRQLRLYLDECALYKVGSGNDISNLYLRGVQFESRKTATVLIEVRTEFISASRQVPDSTFWPLPYLSTSFPANHFYRPVFDTVSCWE
jgi:hypothetical protein